MPENHEIFILACENGRPSPHPTRSDPSGSEEGRLFSQATFIPLEPEEGKSKWSLLNIVMERSRTLTITTLAELLLIQAWRVIQTEYGHITLRSFKPRLIYNLDSLHLPKNEVNFRISGIFLDSAIQDDCKYSTCTHIFLSYQIALIPLVTNQRILWVSAVMIRTRNSRSLWIIKMSYWKLISQSTENRLV